MRPAIAIALAATAICCALTGCVSTTTYQRSTQAKAVNSIDISRPRSEVWKTAIPALARQFFVINNLDQASGLINLSYTGDPERYVDCGTLTITTEGREKITFPAARAQNTYQLTNQQGIPVTVTRRMTLEGRVNIIFEEATPGSTRVTASTRYVVTREAENYRAGTGQLLGQFRHSVSFNTNQVTNFPPSSGAPEGIECHPTGALERDLLEIIR